MPLPVDVMEALLVAVGFTGALTLAWLARRAAALLWPPPRVAAHLSPGGGCVEALVREIAAARREVLFQAGELACRPVAQALVDARLRGANVDVLLGPAGEAGAASDLAFLREQGMTPRASDRPLSGPLVLIDGRSLVTATFPLAGGIDSEVAGGLFVIKGHPELTAPCRRAFGEPSPAPEEPAPAPDPLEGLARANLAVEPPAPAGPAPDTETARPAMMKAAVDLLDRLRREAADAEKEGGAEEKAA